MEEKARAALVPALASAGVTVEEDILDYLSDICGGVLEEAEDRASAEQELGEVVEAHLEDAGANAAAIKAVCAAMAGAKFGAADKAAAKGKAAAKSAAGAKQDSDMVCKIPDLILMYGGSSKALLSHTAFEMRKGCRYGIVGHNGAGKTTLFQALLSGALRELPADLSLVHVHGGSVMESGDPEMAALDYAKQRRQELGVGQAAGAAGAPDAAEALEAVGFGADMQAKALGQLSGGWRMRLALACVMMKRCDVLLLDEPTNHLDAAAVAWLGKYLQGLPGTTLIISHEPEFLDVVCTDIIHFDKQKLNYYQGNFSHFLEKASIKGDEAKAVLETKSRPQHRKPTYKFSV